MKPLTLKRRGPNWHDAWPLTYAIESIAQGKPFVKAAPWLSIAAKVELAKEDVENFEQEAPEIAIELKNSEVRLLWRELKELPAEKFGRNRMTGEPIVPPAGLLYLMLADFAEQLGVEMPEVDED